MTRYNISNLVHETEDGNFTEGEPIPNPLRLPVGSVVSGLKIVVRDEHGDIIADDKLFNYLQKSSTITENWPGKTSREIRKHSWKNNDISDIKVPNNCAGQEETIGCSVIAYTGCKTLDSFDFIIIAVPEKPYQWKLVHSVDGEVISCRDITLKSCLIEEGS